MKRGLGFAVVVTLAVLSVFGTHTAAHVAAQWRLFVPAAAAYYALGLAVFPRLRSRPALAAYFAAQIALGGWITSFAAGGMLPLILFPLIAQAIELSRVWMGAVAVTIVLFMTAQGGIRSGVIAAIVASFVAYYVVIAKRERELSAEVGEAAAIRERNRLAQELHDSLGHYLTIISVQLEGAKAVMATDPRRSTEAMQRAQDTARSALVALRQSVESLKGSEGAPLPLQLATLISRVHGPVQVTLAVEGAERYVPAAAGEALLATAQEALTNVFRHAAASAASVMLAYDTGALRLVVRDDGHGDDAPRDGHGLHGIRDRVGALGGTVSIATAPGEGFRLEVQVPA